ncbi:MAG: ribosome small subunit-dependent GTPase A [Lachnospiraceae bacterium]|nr:ribosome small subunit-dependent GTPase A [Lachnospiraceae bacterium]
MQGKIIKGIAGFYYVHVEDKGVYECKAKGIFRKDNTKPLVGDDVQLEILSEEEMTGNIVQILSRRSELIRPAVANVDQAVIIFAITKPSPNLNLLDRFLVMMKSQDLPCIICFNKLDIADPAQQEHLRSIYEPCGYQVLFVSAKEAVEHPETLDPLRQILKGKTTTVAGPSGVGKSSLINSLQSDVCMETGEISSKIERGKHTTRHSQLIALSSGTYIMDTPGFSSLGLFDMEKEDLQQYYPEFAEYEVECKFGGCSHISEPVCGIKEAVKAGKIAKERYENYKLLYEELKSKKKF